MSTCSPWARAQEELDPTLSSRRLLAELGMTGEDDQLAKPIGDGLWKLHDKVMIEDELEQQLVEEVAATERRARFSRELGTDSR